VASIGQPFVGDAVGVEVEGVLRRSHAEADRRGTETRTHGSSSPTPSSARSVRCDHREGVTAIIIKRRAARVDVARGPRV
jgi:hypothetical protein